MEGLLAFGGIIFWSVIVIAILILANLLEDDNKGKLGWPITFLTSVIVVVYMCYRKDANSIINSITMKELVYSILGYLGVGIIWSFFKWYRYVGYQWKEYQKKVKYWRDRDSSVPTELHVVKGDFQPVASENKEQLSSWILFWPFSIIRYAIGNLLRDVLNKITTFFGGIYDRITASHFN